jgi:hypothetical protein
MCVIKMNKDINLKTLSRTQQGPSDYIREGNF